MTTNNLLSTSLFTELFQHNMVSPDGRILANKKQLEGYYAFLAQQSKERTTSLYAERKNLVDAAQKLLKDDERTEQQSKMLKELLNELDLNLEEDGSLSLKDEKMPHKRPLGSNEPKKSLFEKEIDAELKRMQVLKRDLRVLDDWLQEISGVSPTAARIEDLADWKAANRRFRQRTGRRMHDMENARNKLIKHHYVDYETAMKEVLKPKPTKKASPSKKYSSGIKTPYKKIEKMDQDKDQKDGEKALKTKEIAETDE